MPLSFPGPPQGQAVAPPPDRPLVGIGFCLGAGFVFAGADALSKVLALTLPALEITWLRWAGLLVIVAPALVASRGGTLASRAPGLQVVRACCITGSSVLFMAGLSFLPLASTTAINFVAPLFVTALSVLLLRETAGPRRWAAVGAGLAGVLVVVRPGSGVFGPAAILPVLSAACWACGLIATRRLGGIDRPWTAMTVTALVGFAILSALVPAVFVTPSWPELGIAAAMAALAAAGQFLTVMAYTRAPASLVAPFTYAMLIWASGLGYLLFGDLPDGWTWTGAAIIVASGLYTAHRERVRARDEAGLTRRAA